MLSSPFLKYFFESEFLREPAVIVPGVKAPISPDLAFLLPVCLVVEERKQAYLKHIALDRCSDSAPHFLVFSFCETEAHLITQ